jgi:hypothetical protein
MSKKPIEKPEIIIQRAERLKQVRIILRLGRDYLEKKYHIPAATLKAWENGLTSITEKGLKRCIDMYRQEGMLLNREWILFGIGLSPRVSLDMGKYLASELQYPKNEEKAEYPKVSDDVTPYIIDETACILREAAFFKKEYQNSVVLSVINDDMEPVYQIGDYVGGIFRYGKSINTVAKIDCIIRLTSGELLVRRLFKDADGRYNLVCINPIPSISNMPIMFDAKIECVAPIIWHRKPNP